MPRPRQIPATQYPSAAEQAYFSALNRAIVAWFHALADDLSHALGFRMDGEGSSIKPDANAPLMALRTDDFEALDLQLSHALEQTRRTAATAARHAQAAQVERVTETARARWQALDQQLQQAIGEAHQMVNRLSERNVQRQIDAALTNRRLSVTVQPPPFGALQAQMDRAARQGAALIRDIGDRAARDIEALALDAVAQGTAPDVLRAQIQHRLTVTRSRAALIAQNQTARLESELSLIRGESAGAIGFVWLETVSPHPRTNHLANVGRTFPLSYRPLPRQEPNCKCSMRFVFDDLGEQLDRTRAANERLRQRLTR